MLDGCGVAAPCLSAGLGWMRSGRGYERHLALLELGDGGGQTLSTKCNRVD